MNNINTALMICTIALCTWLCRGLPFLIFGRKKAVPRIISYISTVLPAAIMIILVLYCLRSTEFTLPPYGAVEFISIAVIVALHLYRKNTIISILGGTACYMILIRLIH